MGPINATLHGTQKERVQSLGGNAYVLNMVEEKSIYAYTRLARDKAQLSDLFITGVNFLQTQTRKKLKDAHTDGGTEICNSKVETFLQQNGTIHTVSPPYKPALNGIAERMNRTLMEMTRALLIQAGAHISLWGEAFKMATFIHNCTPKLINGKLEAPAKILFGTAPDPARLRVFGCDVWHTLPHNEQSKLSPRAEKAMFIGYASDGITYRILKPNSFLRPILTRDVKFDEQSFTVSAELVTILNNQRTHDINSVSNSRIDPRLALGLTDEMEELRRHTSFADDDAEIIVVPDPVTHTADDTHTDTDTVTANSDHSESEPSSPRTPIEPSESELEEKYDTHTHDTEPEIGSTLDGSEQEREPLSPTPVLAEKLQSDPSPQPQAQQTQSQSNLRRSNRNIRPVDRGAFVDTTNLTRTQRTDIFGALIAAAEAVDVKVDPSTYKQAISRPDASKWKEAINSELGSMSTNKVWKLVKPPPGAAIIKNRWVFKTKLDEQNRPIKYKARLVAKGFQQEHGVNYDETYAPVAHHKSIKLVMALVNELDLEFKQIDFVTAFLNAPLDYQIFMEQPEGMPTRGDGRVLLLLKALYGLKQASRQWNIELHNWLVQHGYQPITQDACIYVKRTKDGRMIILCLYVDDTGVAYHIKDEAIWLADKAAIAARFPITDLGDCRWMLGMEIRRDRAKGIMTISQQAYTERVLKQFDLLECRPRSLPMAHNGELELTPRDGTPVKPLDAKGKQLYQSIVGSILYAACLTRMDLSHTTAKLAQFCAAPAEHHMLAAKHALRYLAGTRTLGLVFRRSGNKIINPTVCPDASWISEIDTGRSHSGVITLINDNPIHWWSKRQSMVALSSTEAEYIAMGEAAKDAVWLREWLIAVLGVTAPININIMCDNQAAIKIAANNTDSARTRHYSARHHYIRELIHDNQLKIEWTNTRKQPADMLTKQLTEEKLRIWRDRFLTHVTL